FFLRSALPAHNYKASADWEKFLVLSPAGEEALHVSGVSPRPQERANVLMAMFCVFFHHELVIDCAKCDLRGLHQLVNSDLISGRLRWPHRFGRLLYDKFNDAAFDDRTDHLLPDEALTLVEGTAQGVAQVGQSLAR